MKKEEPYTQMYTQTTEKSETPRSILINENSQELNSRGSLAWFGRQTHNLECVKKGATPRSREFESRPRHFFKSRRNSFSGLIV